VMPGFDSIGDEDEDVATLKAFYGDHIEITEEPDDKPNTETDAGTQGDAPAAGPDGTVVDQAATAPTASDTPLVSAQELETLRAAAKAQDDLQKLFAVDPATAIQTLLNSGTIDDAKRLEILKQYGVNLEQKLVADSMDLKDYTPESDLEKVLFPMLPELRNVGKNLEGLRKEVDDTFVARDRDLMLSYATAVAASARQDAICKALGIDIPAPNYEAIFKSYDPSKGSLEEAITATYVPLVTKAAEVAAQILKERPDTPRTGHVETKEVKINSMLDAYDVAGQMLGIED